MLTVVGMWEPSFSEHEQCIEYRMWKQTIAAYDIKRWIMVGEGPQRISSFEAFKTMPEALDTIDSMKIFMVPEHGQELSMVWPGRDCAFIFGNADNNLLGYVGKDDWIAHIETPKPVDMFAACVLPMVLQWP